MRYLKEKKVKNPTGAEVEQPRLRGYEVDSMITDEIKEVSECGKVPIPQVRKLHVHVNQLTVSEKLGLLSVIYKYVSDDLPDKVMVRIEVEK